MTDNIKPVKTLLQNFRQSRISDHTLPISRLEVRLKSVSVEDLATSGQIPDTLTALVMRTAVSGKAAAISTDDLPTMLTLFGAVAKASLVYPPVIDGEGDDEHLGLNELPFGDKEYIFNVANGGAKRLESFRPKQGRDGAPVPDGQNVQPATE